MSEQHVFEAVADAIVQLAGVRREEVVPEARVQEDLGIYGDDGRELLAAIDCRFVMDWRDIWPEVHFGSEGSFSAAARYQPQPLTVARLVAELRTGSWSGTELVEQSSLGSDWSRLRWNAPEIAALFLCIAVVAGFVMI